MPYGLSSRLHEMKSTPSRPKFGRRAYYKNEEAKYEEHL